MAVPSEWERFTTMQIEMTAEAAELLGKRGGTMAIDFIKAVG